MPWKRKHTTRLSITSRFSRELLLQKYTAKISLSLLVRVIVVRAQTRMLFSGHLVSLSIILMLGVSPRSWETMRRRQGRGRLDRRNDRDAAHRLAGARRLRSRAVHPETLRTGDRATVPRHVRRARCLHDRARVRARRRRASGVDSDAASRGAGEAVARLSAPAPRCAQVEWPPTRYFGRSAESAFGTPGSSMTDSTSAAPRVAPPAECFHIWSR